MPTEPTAVSAAIEALFAPDAPHGVSLALLAVHRGEVVLERYGTQPDTPFGPGEAVTADTTLISWSMAKSITHAAVGMAVADGLLELDTPAPVAEWRNDERAAITLQDLLDMRSGLEFVEDYVDDSISHCIDMLFGGGADDVAAYAAALPMLHPPGTVWNYSSGTTNIVSRILGDALAARDGTDRRTATERFLHERLFEPAGMTSATVRFDAAGTFIGSSFVYATARDFARFGELYLHDGVVDGRRILPEGWREHARTWVADDPGGPFPYGRHWWLRHDLPGLFAAHGYEGQFTVVWPENDLVVVHLGKSPADRREPLLEHLHTVVAAFAS